MKEPVINCNEVIDYICENLSDEIDSPRCREIKKHLEECDSCKNYFHSVDKTISFYKKYNVKLSEQGHNKLIKYLGLDE